jgi:hypothetical protein
VVFIECFNFIQLFVQEFVIWGREIFNEKLQYLKGNLILLLKFKILFYLMPSLICIPKAIFIKYNVEYEVK